MIYDMLVVMFVVALDENTPKTRCGGNVLIVRGNDPFSTPRKGSNLSALVLG
jgi:hypothetical protein